MADMEMDYSVVTYINWDAKYGKFKVTALTDDNNFKNFYIHPIQFARFMATVKKGLRVYRDSVDAKGDGGKISFWNIGWNGLDF